MRVFHFRVLVLAMLCVWQGCARSTPSDDPSQTGSATSRSMTLATTTSAQDSGLLDVLLPAFEKQSGIQVKVVAVGSGQALELGRRGDADLLLTHSPSDEEKFVEAGWGRNRRPLMHNDFIILGPADDPARIKQVKSAAEAFRAIAETSCVFVSRGDESGTHKKELAIWKAAGINPEGSWYISSGTGMALSLRMAHEKHGYILTDRGTYLSLKAELELIVDFEGDPLLRNHYSVMEVNPARHSHVKSAEAISLAEFLLSQPGQEIIRSFGTEKYGQPLFVPDVGKVESK